MKKRFIFCMLAAINAFFCIATHPADIQKIEHKKKSAYTVDQEALELAKLTVEALDRRLSNKASRGAFLTLISNQKIKDAGLLCAAKKYNKQLVTLLLLKKANPDVQDAQGFTPLHIVLQPKVDSVELFQSAYDTIIAQHKKKKVVSLQHTSHQIDSLKKRFDTVLALPHTDTQITALKSIFDKLCALSLNADQVATLIKKCDELIKQKDTSDHLVASLLKNNADVQLQNDQGATPLCFAAYFGNEEAMKKLMEYGASVHLSTTVGASPLYLAAQSGHIKAVSLLLKYKANINQKHSKGISPIYAACENGHTGVVNLLLDHGVDLHEQNKYGTLLHYAAQNGHVPIMNVLLKKGAQVNNQENEEKTTPLHLAVQNGHKDAVILLLDNGADPNLTEKEGMTALHIAAYYGHTAIANLLLQRRATVNKAMNLQITPLYFAAQNDHPDIVKLLIDHNADVNIQHEIGCTPLYRAVAGQNKAVIQLLLDTKDIQIDAPCNQDGTTALHIACEFGQKEIASTLLKTGAKIHISDDHGATALYKAAQYGYEPIVKILLRGGADRAKKDKLGWTAARIARENGHYRIAKLIKNWQAPAKKTKRKDKKNRSIKTIEQKQEISEIPGQKKEPEPIKEEIVTPSKPATVINKDLVLLTENEDYAAYRQRRSANHAQAITLIIYKQKPCNHVSKKIILSKQYKEKHNNKERWDTFHQFSDIVDQYLPYGLYIDGADQSEAIRKCLCDYNVTSLFEDQYAIIIPGNIMRKGYNFHYAMVDQYKKRLAGFSGAFVYICNKKSGLCCHRFFHTFKAGNAYGMKQQILYEG